MMDIKIGCYESELVRLVREVREARERLAALIVFVRAGRSDWEQQARQWPCWRPHSHASWTRDPGPKLH